MKGYETTIRITANKSHVWNKLIDTKNYDHWNPLIKTVSSPFEIGKKTIVTIVPLNKRMAITPIKIIENQELIWNAIQIHPLLLKANHYFYLKDTGDTSMELIHGEEFSGLFSYFISKKIYDKLAAGFANHNAVLKELIEQEVLV